jgi:serine/threonine protein kinase
MYVAMEFCVNGDLRSYLRKMKRCKNNLYANAKPISPIQKSVLLKFALDVASGLSHLADRQVTSAKLNTNKSAMITSIKKKEMKEKTGNLLMSTV